MSLIFLIGGFFLGYVFHDDIKKWLDNHSSDGGGPLGA